MDRTERFYKIDQLLGSGTRTFAEGWVLQNVLGIANAPVAKALQAFASNLAERYNEKPGRGQSAARPSTTAAG